MKIINRSSLLLFLFIIAFSIPSNAVIDYKPDGEKKTTIVKKQKKAKKKGLLKRWKEKLILKKFKKLQKKTETNSLNKKASLSIWLGVGSIIALLLSVLAIGGNSGVILIASFILAFLLALFGIITSIKILMKTYESKEEYIKERRKAKWGLTISILAGLPVLGLLTFAIILSNF